MNYYELFRDHISELIAIVSGLIGGSLIERKRKKIAVKQADADATGKLMDLYQEALDDLKKRYEERIAELQTQHDNKLVELEKKWNDKFNELEDEINRLRTNLELWKTKYRKLKDEFSAYKKSMHEKSKSTK